MNQQQHRDDVMHIVCEVECFLDQVDDIKTLRRWFRGVVNARHESLCAEDFERVTAARIGVFEKLYFATKYAEQDL